MDQKKEKLSARFAKWITAKAYKHGIIETDKREGYTFFRFLKLRTHKLTNPKTVTTIWSDKQNFSIPEPSRKWFGSRYLIPGGLIIEIGERWQKLHDLFSKPMGRQAVQDKIAPVVLEKAREMAKKWEAQKKIPDLEKEMLNLTGDIIMQSVFGDSLPKETKAGIIDTIAKTFASTREPTRLGNWLKKANMPYDHVGFLPSMILKATGIYHGLRSIIPPTWVYKAWKVKRVLQKNVEARRKLEKQPDDLVGHMINNGLTTRDVVSQSLMMIVAGHETSAGGLTFTFMELMKDEAAQKKIRDEFNRVTKNGSRPLTGADYGSLPEAQNALKRAMHLHPPFFMLTREAENDVEVDGIKFKKHDLIMADLRDMHALHPTPPGASAPAAGTSKPFGEGPRRCIGATFSTIESVLIISEFFNRLSLRMTSAPAGKKFYFTTHPDGPVAVEAARLAA